LHDEQELSHPTIAANIVLYPELEPERVSEVWEAERWLDFDRSLLNPMWTSDSLKQYFVNEIARLVDGSYVLPLMWATVKGVVHAKCVSVIRMTVSASYLT
jgi:hypothetical protein